MFTWHETSLMWTSMIVFWLLLGFFAYYAVRSVIHHRGLSSGADATVVLEQRLARGEISSEEYRERRATLDTTPPKGRQG